MTCAVIRSPLPPWGTLLLGQPHWVWLAAGILLLAALLLALLYRQTRWPLRLRWIAGTLKGGGVALIAACLLEPLWSGTRARPGENLVLVAADVSASLTVEDGPGRSPRWRQFHDVLADERLPWQVRLGQDFRVRRYTVASTATAVQTFEGLSYDAPHSRLGRSLKSLLDRYRQQPVAAILLLTDGNSTDDLEPLFEQLGDGPPIYPILPETPTEIRDVSIERTAVTLSSFEDAPASLQADVRCTPNIDEPVVARLLDESGALVEEQTLTPGVEGGPLPFRFQVRPPGPLTVYRLQVRAESDSRAFAEPPQTNEATLANNQRLISVSRAPGPYRVLYVGGRPNWEFKFLRRSLAEDSDVQLVGLIRIARKEPKFEFLGREGESTNPLFRGFRKEADEETESYDEAVVIALGVKDERELAGGRFPRTPEELFQYHAVILDDVEAAFFLHEQQALLERFVAQRGGGLLMLGGPQSFHHGGWHKTPLKDVLPVYFDRSLPPLPGRIDADPPPEWRMQLTRDGWLQPWVRLRKTEQEESRRIGAMSGFQVISRISGIKPAAQVLASVVGAEGTTAPALVAQTYGDGRSAAVLIGDLWRWSLKREAGAEDDLGKAWRQLVRWLVTETPQRVQGSLKWTTAGDSEAVSLRVRVRDERFDPQENAAVRVTVSAPEEAPLPLALEPSLSEPGLFETLYVPRRAGSYRAEFEVTDADGRPLGTAQVGWVFEPAAEEFRRVEVDRAAMQRLAEASGGAVLSPRDLSSLVEELPNRDVPLKESWTTPLWHSPWMLAAILLTLAGEWGLRRWRGLP